MKKTLSIVLAVCVLFSVCVMTGCGGSAEKLKFGVGISSSYTEGLSAKDDTPGSLESEHTIAAVTLSKDGKIVDCKIDTITLAPGFTSDGSAITTEDVISKYEQGDDYNMVAYGKAKYEWYKQADNFCKLVKGKTIDEVKALVAAGGSGKGNDEVVKAGCTIVISDFILAVEKAVKNAADSNVTKNDKLNVAIVAVQGENRNATAEADGVNEIDAAFSAAAVDKDGKVVAMASDAITASAAFTIKGIVKNDITKDILTKKEQGDSYGMVAYGKAEKEWDEQAAAFDSICVGKTADQIVELEVSGYGNEDVQNAGCTIAISDMVKAAVKAATID